ncbi:MAG: peptide deformylase [Thermoplasmatales archaeon]
MAIKPLVIYPDPRLRVKCEAVSEINSEIVQLVQDLKDTLIHEEGLGLAAPQIGVLKRVFVFRRRVNDEYDEIQEVINPVLELGGDMIDSEEGCLSIPGYRDTIRRHGAVNLKGINLSGQELCFSLSGLEARCAQHENDHLNGVLFIDHFNFFQKKLFNDWVRKQPWFVEEKVKV